MKDVGKFKRNMRISMGIFITLFLILIGYMCYSIVTYGERWFATPYNPRLQAAIQSIDAGSIYDTNGVELAWTEDGERQYNSRRDVRRAVSHVVGDPYGLAATGVESFHAKYLLGFGGNVFERLYQSIVLHQRKGENVTSTIAAQLCKYA